MSNSDEQARVQATLAGFATKTWQPHSYQVAGIDWLTHRIAAALFLAPGLGKTSTTLAAIIKLQKEGLVKRVLVLAPLKVCATTWLQEPKNWAQFQHLKVGFAHGPNKVNVLNNQALDIVVMNYDGIPWAVPLLIKGHNFQVLVCDELTKLKSASSQRFKVLKKLLPSFTFRWGLTASPVANGYIDLFGQVYTLDLGMRFGSYITHFRNAYFYQTPYDEFHYHISDENAALITSKLKDLAMYVDPKEHLKLPGLVDIVRPVSLQNMAEYRVLRDDYILAVQDVEITALSAGILTGKLRQFTGGAMYDQDRNVVTVGNDKLDVLAELIEELNGEPLIVAYQYSHEAERICKLYPKARVIRGGMTVKALQEIIADWELGTIPLLLVQPKAGSHGINLQLGGHAICWFSLTYSLEEYDQLIARIYRQGQTHIVRNYILTALGTIDEVLAQVLVKKDKTQESVFVALKTQL